MLFIGARRVVNVVESGTATRQYLDSPVVKENYKQMFLDNHCQLQSCGSVKVSVPTQVGRPLHLFYSYFSVIFFIL
jgi:hypothetical protein